MRNSGTSFVILLLVSTTLASSDSFLEKVKLTTETGDKICTCSFAMALDGEGKKVDVKRSKVICEDECNGKAEDLELEADEDCSNFYIVDAFSVSNGKGTIERAMVVLKPCDQTARCTDGFPGSSVKGFCSKDGHSAEGVECLPGEGACDCPGCACCKECIDTTCSDKGEGWSCYSAEEAATLPEGSCVADESCSKTPGSPYKGDCACCKKLVANTTTSPPITISTTAIDLGFCAATRGCEEAYEGMGVRGFCGDKSLLGGDCSSADQDGGNHYCKGEGCTCCKECLDMRNKCSDRGEGWSCYNKKSALALPEGSCVFDRSCSSAPDSPYKDSSCACCKKDPYPCEDYGCSKQWNGMGGCVNVSSADWVDVDANFNLSIPGIPGMCGPECPDSKCVCLKKKKLCADEGCSSFFNGAGVCLNALDPDFAEMSPSLDFAAGAREDLCAGCCSCFKKRCLDTVHGTVAFAVDTTGSMQKSLPLVKATISNIVESGSDVPKWVLTGFNDPSVTVVKETALSEELKSAADSLTFGGGGDAKEQALQGIDVTLDTMPDNGILLVFTDTGSKRLDLRNAVKEKSLEKNVKIVFAILTTPGVIETASLEAYEHLSDGQIFYASADGSDMADIKAFFETVVSTVQNPCH